MSVSRIALFVMCASALAIRGRAGAINFEGLDDLTILTNQYPGVVFFNATVLKSQFSLNEGDFPPRSGENVASNLSGDMLLTFKPEVESFTAYFTYTTQIKVIALDSTATQVDTSTALFTENTASSGNPPNEIFNVSSAAGITFIRIDSAGGMFTIDDIRFTSIPEPASMGVTGAVLLILGVVRKRRVRR